MDALSSAAPTGVNDGYDADLLIVGSGFGGSVCAVRLVERQFGR
jgi:hypothetical protein